MSHTICPECGARLADGAERCDLCGAPVESSAQEGATAARDSDSGPPPEDIPEPLASSEPNGVYCNQCGWQNPPDARYCSQCGSRLQPGHPSESDVPVKPVVGSSPSASDDPAGSLPRRPPDGPTSETARGAPRDSLSGLTSAEDQGEAGLSRYVGALVGLAVLIVVALYMITVVSKQNARSGVPTTGAVEAPANVRSAAVIEEYESIPISERFSATVDSFRMAIDEADGAASLETERRLVDFLIDIGRIDRAAIEQQRMAARSDSIVDWRRAGGLLTEWMETVRENRKTDVALLAIDAYERVLEKNPDDLDVRAELGWVYQFDPQNPMAAIQQTNLVLEADPEHLAANYNRGVFLLRINRLSEALKQFEKVKMLAAEDSPYYRQADVWIETVRRQQEAQR